MATQSECPSMEETVHTNLSSAIMSSTYSPPLPLPPPIEENKGTVNDDEDEEIWDLTNDLRSISSNTQNHVITRRKRKLTKMCMTQNCNSIAISTWTSTKGNVWDTCEECQLRDFGGWPVVPNVDNNDNSSQSLSIEATAAQPSSDYFFLDLPDDVLYIILTYIARPTERVSKLCHSLSILSSSIHYSINEHRASLWESILHQEYNDDHHHDESYVTTLSSKRRRSSKRLKLHPKHIVRESHLRLCDRNDMAHIEFLELAHYGKPKPLSLHTLRSIFRKYHQTSTLQINRLSIPDTSFGCNFVVDCCNAKSANENVILKCLKELIEKYGASVDVDGLIVSPLCIAAARGMPSIVRYLVEQGACIERKGTGMFQSNRSFLSSTSSSSTTTALSRSRKVVKGTYTPLGFALAMKRAEEENRIALSERSGRIIPRRGEDVLLDQCIRILRRAERSKMGEGTGESIEV